jgi:AcrR family transcriptional regulator
MATTNRQKQKAETRALLIETAYELFSAGGIMATRMSDIAAAAGVSHGTVFLHFGSQEALIEEVAALYGIKIAGRTHELADAGAGLTELLRAHLRVLGEFEPFYTRLIGEYHQLPQGARDSLIAVRSILSLHFSQAFDREFGQLQRFGLVSGSMVFNIWLGLVHYYLMNGALFAPEGGVLRRHGETLVGSFVALLGN